MNNVAIKYDPVSIRWMGYHTALKQFLDETAFLPDVPKGDKNVKVVYASPSSALTKNVIPMVNGQVERPVITFYLEDEETSTDVASAYFTMEDYVKQSDGNFTRISYNHPLVKKLTYSCHVFATKMSDCDYLLTLLELNCNKYRPYSCKVNGRTSYYYLDNVKTGTPTDYDGKKIIYSTFEVTVPRAMILPAEIETDAGRIEQIHTYLCGEVDTIPRSED